MHIRRRQQKYFVGRKGTGGVFPGGDAFVYHMYKSRPREGGARDRETEDRHTPREPAGTCLVCYSLEITENHILLALEHNHIQSAAIWRIHLACVHTATHGHVMFRLARTTRGQVDSTHMKRRGCGAKYQAHPVPAPAPSRWSPLSAKAFFTYMDYSRLAN